MPRAKLADYRRRAGLVNQDYVSSLDQVDSLLLAANRPALPNPSECPDLNTGPKSRKLIVTHDFKAGYSEDEFETGYSFEWLALIDLFIYFSHHRISLPPAQWIIAAHNHHTPILATLIFEHNSLNDLQLLLAGPSHPSRPANHFISLSPSSPGHLSHSISSYYADRLIDLASQRHFHGWLINIELDLAHILPAHAQQLARALRIWVNYLRVEGERRLGACWQVCWYDSLSHLDGRLQWQSRLHAKHNLPYFAAASSIFLDYHWSNAHLRATAALLARLPRPPVTQPLTLPSDTLAALAVRPLDDLKQAVYVGVDVYGRGCPHGGGFASWRAAQDILAAGHSVALFAPGWTWEAHQLHPDREPASEGAPDWWARWWRDERYLWTGLVEPGPAGQLTPVQPPNAHVDACRIAAEAKRPLPARATSPSELPHHVPLATLFAARTLPSVRAFYTNWSLGAGTNGFWACGRHHVEGMRTWTDMAMSFPIHTLAIAGGTLWGLRDRKPVDEGRVQCEVTSADGWLGSGCVEVREQARATAQESDVRFVWMNPTNIEPQAGMLTCQLVWKPLDPARPTPLGIALDAAASSHLTVPVPVSSLSEPAIVLLGTDSPSPVTVAVSPLAHGWHKTVLQIPAPAGPVVRLGLAVGGAFGHLVGEMSVVAEGGGGVASVWEVRWEGASEGPEGAEQGSLWGSVRWSWSSSASEPVMWLVYMAEAESGSERLVASVRGCREVDVCGYVAERTGAVRAVVRAVGWAGQVAEGECVCR